MKKILFLLLFPCLVHAQGVLNRPIQRFISSGISGTTAASILLATTENGTETFYPEYAVIFLSANTVTSFTLATTISIGTNSPNYNNILPSTTLTGLTAVNSMLVPQMTSVISSVPANTPIYVKVGAMTLPLGGSTFTLRVILYGDYW